MSRVFVFMSRVCVFMSRVSVFMSRVSVWMSRVCVFMYRVYQDRERPDIDVYLERRSNVSTYTVRKDMSHVMCFLYIYIYMHSLVYLSVLNIYLTCYVYVMCIQVDVHMYTATYSFHADTFLY